MVVFGIADILNLPLYAGVSYHRSQYLSIILALTSVHVFLAYPPIKRLVGQTRGAVVRMDLHCRRACLQCLHRGHLRRHHDADGVRQHRAAGPWRHRHRTGVRDGAAHRWHAAYHRRRNIHSLRRLFRLFPRHTLRPAGVLAAGDHLPLFRPFGALRRAAGGHGRRGPGFRPFWKPVVRERRRAVPDRSVHARHGPVSRRPGEDERPLQLAVRHHDRKRRGQCCVHRDGHDPANETGRLPTGVRGRRGGGGVVRRVARAAGHGGRPRS